MNTDILQHTISRVVKSLWYWQTKPERKFIKTILENILEYKTTVLYKLWNTEIMPAKKWCEYYSSHLWKSCWKDLWKKVEKMAVKFIWKLDSNTNICFDWVDVNKNKSKKMEGLKKVRDASNNSYWNGYILHGVSINWIPLFLHRERQKIDAKDKSIRMDMFTSQLNKVKEMIGNNHWILADRLYDDFKKFKLLIEEWFKFSIRFKNNRKVTIIEWNNRWEKLSIPELQEWNYTVSITWVSQELYVFVKKFEWQKTPMRVISNVNDEIALNKYFERWEIERIFKVWKQEYELEKIGTQAIQKTENLIYLVQLCLWISTYIYKELQSEMEPRSSFWKVSNFQVITKKIIKKIKPFLRKKSLTFNRNSITNFLAYYMAIIRKTKTFFKNTILKPVISSQLSIF